MIAQSPSVSELTLERELEEFERLKLRLADLWPVIFPGDDEHYTSVVVPSMSLDTTALGRMPGVAFYEERLLFLLERLRNPRARVVYVTSQPIPPIVLEYYLQFLAGIPASHARQRLTLVCAHDATPRPLTEKILERPRLLDRIRAGIPDPSRAYLTVFNATPLERRLAVLLGIPMNGVDPRLSFYGTKSGGRKVFREAGVGLPLGAEDVHTEDEIEQALVRLRRMRPGLRHAILKLNESHAGEGNALLRFPAAEGREELRAAMRQVRFAVPTTGIGAFFETFARGGGVVEEFIEDGETASPSVQLRVNPRGEVVLIATHDQILGGQTGQVFLGCRFPARDEYRLLVQDAAVRIGRVLAEKGVVSRFSIDFLVSRPSPEMPWSVFALEINLRMGGTTHPFLALRFLTDGHLDHATGVFLSPAGRPKCYRATDKLQSEAYRGLLSQDLIEISTVNRLHYDSKTERGVIFHSIGALSQYGRLGLTVIANTHEEVEDLYLKTVATFEDETGYCRRP